MMSSTDSIFVLTDGRGLGYARYGVAGGIPVIYCHGGLSSRLDIAFAGQAAARAGLDLVAVDRPGIGLSDFQKHRALADWPADVAALADHLAFDQFALLGWSGGSPYVLACLAALGARITTAALVGGMAPVNTPGRVAELGLAADRLLFPLAARAPWAARFLLAVAARRSVAKMHESMIESMVSASDKLILSAMDEHDTTAAFFEALRPGAHGTARDYAIMGGDWGFALTSITSPLVLWQGGEDTLVPISHARSLSEQIPNAVLRVLPNRGHFLLHAETDWVFSHLASGRRRVIAR